MRYEGDIYRPPSEWNSYLLQATIGCSHNACTFCGMFKNKNYRTRDLKEVLADIDMAKATQPNVETVFLCDGDAIDLPMEYILQVLRKLYDSFPKLKRVSTYAGPRSTMRKIPEGLSLIRKAGLHRVYLGIETGDGEVLVKRGKGVDADGMLRAGLALKEAGYEIWGIIMVGLAGGGDAYIREATMTADMINKIEPQHLSAMTYTPVPGTPMYKEIEDGKFTVQTPRESLQETILLVEKLEQKGLHFTSNHASNYVSVDATLSEDREKVLASLNQALNESDSTLLNKSHHGRL